MKTIGLVATYKSGLGNLKQSGQHERLLNYYFPIYLKQFDQLFYFSYMQERIEDFTSDPDLIKRIKIFARPWWMPSLIYAFAMPLIYFSEFRSCKVFRVFQAVGIFPLLNPLLWFKTCLVTYGYHYAKLARSEGAAFWKVIATSVAEWVAFRRASIWLVTSDANFKYVLRKTSSRASIVSIPNGVDIDSFKPLEKKNGSDEVKNIIFVGRFVPVKNLETLIRAAASLSKEIPLRLTFVGAGPLEANLVKKAYEQNVNLTIVPPIPNSQLPGYLQTADIFSLLSWSEGSPKALIEAMSCGLPCVVSNCEGNRQFVQHEQSGLLCDLSKFDDVLNQFRKVLSNETIAKQLGNNARQFISNRYSLNWLLNQEAKLLRELSENLNYFSPKKSGKTFVGRWLAVSCRRRLLDEDLRGIAGLFYGDVLEVGAGAAIHRGKFRPPWWQVRSWTTFNKDQSAQPDVLGNIETTSLKSEAYDIVCCLETFQYFQNVDQALFHMNRLLKPGGRLVLSIPYMHFKDHDEDRWRFTKEEMKNFVNKSGFSIEQALSQGGVLSGLAHLLKVRITRISNRGVRFFVGLLFCTPLSLLLLLDRYVPRRYKRIKSTGYLFVATKDIQKVQFIYDPSTIKKMRNFYQNYYKDELGLPDWSDRVSHRTNEEEWERISFVNVFKEIHPLSGRKFLNVGCGTGGINIVAHREGMDSYGIDLSEPAIEICKEKAEQSGMDQNHFLISKAEELPFPDNMFDAVYCRSVLEHVQDPVKSIQEMVRVTKPNGIIYLNAPNYNSFYEGHYKIFWLPQFPKRLAAWYLRLRGRPSEFINTINYITPGKIRRVLGELSVRVRQSKIKAHPDSSLLNNAVRMVYKAMRITPGEFWIYKIGFKEKETLFK